MEEIAVTNLQETFDLWHWIHADITKSWPNSYFLKKHVFNKVTSRILSVRPGIRWKNVQTKLSLLGGIPHRTDRLFCSALTQKHKNRQRDAIKRFGFNLLSTGSAWGRDCMQAGLVKAVFWCLLLDLCPPPHPTDKGQNPLFMTPITVYMTCYGPNWGDLQKASQRRRTLSLPWVQRTLGTGQEKRDLWEMKWGPSDHKREDNYTLRKSYICGDDFRRRLRAAIRWVYCVFSLLELPLNSGWPALGRDVAICPCIWLF